MSVFSLYSHTLNLFKKFNKNKFGVAMAEYGLGFALLGGAIMVGTTESGTAIRQYMMCTAYGGDCTAGKSAGAPISSTSFEGVDFQGKVQNINKNADLGGGWKVSGGHVQYHQNSDDGYTASDGNSRLDMNHNGEISNELKTEIGKEYDLSFYMGFNEQYANGDPATIGVFVDGKKVDSFTIDTSNHLSEGQKSEYSSATLQSIKFKAQSELSKITLKALSGNEKGGATIDLVKISQL